VRRLKLNVAAWALGTTALTVLWVAVQWSQNGRLESFGHEGEPGQWNPTLWAVAVGVWALIVGLMALRVHFERPATPAEIDREAARLAPERLGRDPSADTTLRRLARLRLERIGRLKARLAGWALGMVILTPVWALIEWQDNGAFERWSNDSQPGDWDPWILTVGAIWLGVVLLLAARDRLARPPSGGGARRVGAS
jgi:hypothetical protein